MGRKKHRKRANFKPRDRSDFQDASPLFLLPLEVRGRIYSQLLVADHALDLAPEIWLSKQPEETQVDEKYTNVCSHALDDQERITSSNLLELHTPVTKTILLIEGRPATYARKRRYWLKFPLLRLESQVRLHEDLVYVRKELGVGLLGTCRRLYYEAADYFWGQNTFRFSGHGAWFVVLRLFLSVMPRTLCRIKNQEIRAPWIYDGARTVSESLKYPDLNMPKLFEMMDEWDAFRYVVNMLLASPQRPPGLHLVLPDICKLYNDDGEFISLGDLKHFDRRVGLEDSTWPSQDIMTFSRQPFLVECSIWDHDWMNRLGKIIDLDLVVECGWKFYCKPGDFFSNGFKSVTVKAGSLYGSSAYNSYVQKDHTRVSSDQQSWDPEADPDEDEWTIEDALKGNPGVSPPSSFRSPSESMENDYYVDCLCCDETFILNDEKKGTWESIEWAKPPKKKSRKKTHQNQQRKAPLSTDCSVVGHCGFVDWYRFRENPEVNV